MRSQRITSDFKDKAKRRPNPQTMRLNRRLKNLSGPLFNQQIRGWAKNKIIHTKKNLDPCLYPTACSSTTQNTRQDDREALPGPSSFVENTVDSHSSEENIETEAIKEDTFASFLGEVVQLVVEKTEHTSSVPKTKGERKRVDIRHIAESWNEKRISIHDSIISNEAPEGNTLCGNCGIHLDTVIRCSTCVKHLCEKCDSNVHFDHPFHTRCVFAESRYVHIPPNYAVFNGVQTERRKYTSIIKCLP